MTQETHTDFGVREANPTRPFAFGENWRSFLSNLNPERLAEASASLQGKLGMNTLEGLSFLDVGCGSGLFSLAAVQLGAKRVHSFDFDRDSVACAQWLKQEFAPGDADWTIEQGSVLDTAYMAQLDKFDIVYSWGVLHHTGNMHLALCQAGQAVLPGGSLFISIYNDQGLRSRMWHVVKRTYNRLPSFLRTPYVVIAMAPREVMTVSLYVLRLRPHEYLRLWSRYRQNRGMSRWHDFIDWVGGYPFEVASPEVVFNFYRERGFTLESLKTCGGGLGCNEFVFSAPASNHKG